MNEQLNNISVELYKEVLDRGQELEIKVGGSSMWPFIKDGETLVLQKVAWGNIVRGDIIATYTGQRLICHRVFKKNQDSIQTKADALVGFDEEIHCSKVLGKVIAQKKDNYIRRYNSKDSAFLGTCILYFSFLWAPLMPLLRRFKAVFVRSDNDMTSIKKMNSLSNDIILALAGLGLDQVAQGWLSISDQDAFLSAAAREGCTGLIHYNLTQFQPEHNFSKEVCDYLEQEYLVNLGRNLLIDNQLEEICTQFESKKLKALTVRGAVFFDQIYPELGMRPLIDMDFVVHQEDSDRARAILNDLGFECHDCYPFFFFKDNIYVDLHLDSINFWRIKNWPSAIDIKNEKLWQRTVPFRKHAYIRTLDCYDTIIHCSEHLMRHSFDRLIWFLDIAYLLRKESETFQWDQLLDRTKECRAQKAVYYVLAYLNKINYCSVPEDILQDLGNIPLNFLEKKNLNLLLQNKRTNLSGDLMSLCAIEHFGQRVRALWNGIFIEQERFPLVRKKLTPFAYLNRFFRLAGYIVKKTIMIIKAPSF